MDEGGLLFTWIFLLITPGFFCQPVPKGLALITFVAHTSVSAPETAIATRCMILISAINQH